jgi:predicted HicB family RNase H-like nuclease
MAKHSPSGDVDDIDLDTVDIRLPDGTRLTNQVAEEIVDDVRHRSGRPSLTGRPAVSPRVSFRLTPDALDRATAMASREGKTISELAREALEARLRAS